MMCADRSSGRHSVRLPLLARPMGVRAVATITASGMGAPPRSGGCGAAVSLASGQRRVTPGCHTRLPNVTTMSLFEDPNVGTIPEPTFSVTELSDADRQRPPGRVPRRGVGARRDPRPQPRPVGPRVLHPHRPRGRRLDRRDALGHQEGLGEQHPHPGRRHRADERRHRRADPGPARLVLAPRAAPAADDGDRPRLHARPARAGPGRAARPAAGGGPAAGATPRHAMPLAPLRVGLVTSEGSAAEADFLDELRRSGFAFRVLRVDSRVQGFDAPRSIASAIRMLATHPLDVLALVRGGGARTDLAAFDDEAVARAIAALPGAGAHRHRSRGRHLGRRRGGAHRGQDAHRVRPAARGAGRRAGRRARGPWAAIAERERAHGAAPRRAAAAARAPPGSRHPGRARRRRGSPRHRSPSARAGPPWPASIGPATGSTATAVASPARPAPTSAPPRCWSPPASAASPIAPHAPWPRPSGRSPRSRRGCARSTPIAPWPAAGRSPGAPTARSSAPPPTCGRAISSPPASPAATCALRCPTMSDEIGYADALAELEAILEEIEDDAVDVDVLAAKVKRGRRAPPHLPRPHHRRQGRGHADRRRARPRRGRRGLGPPTTRRTAGAYVRWPDALRLQDLTAEHDLVRDARRVAGRRSDRPVRVRVDVRSLRADLLGSHRTVHGGLDHARRARRRRPRGCASGCWSPATRTATRRCSRTWRRRSTSCRTAGSSSGIGAGWNQDESDALGIDLPALKERFDRFDEALEVITRLLSDEVSDFDGALLPAARGAL